MAAATLRELLVLLLRAPELPTNEVTRFLLVVPDVLCRVLLLPDAIHGTTSPTTPFFLALINIDRLRCCLDPARILTATLPYTGGQAAQTPRVSWEAIYLPMCEAILYSLCASGNAYIHLHDGRPVLCPPSPAPDACLFVRAKRRQRGPSGRPNRAVSYPQIVLEFCLCADDLAGAGAVGATRLVDLHLSSVAHAGACRDPGED